MLILSILIRIFSNPLANVFQKKLTNNYGSFLVNSITYGGLSILLIPLIIKINFLLLPPNIWFYGILGGLLGTLGNASLVKSLSLGDLSILGPINAYKPIVAMIFAIFLLKEYPSIIGILGIILIIIGSYFIFDTLDKKNSIKILKRKDILYRFLALFLTAMEALTIKQVILLSDITISFILWCIFGFIFSLSFAILRKEKHNKLDNKTCFCFLGLIIMYGLMQYSTNYVFKNLDVSYALALFQLSAIVSVILGHKFFNEKNFSKKLLGSIIMVIGAITIILS